MVYNVKNTKLSKQYLKNMGSVNIYIIFAMSIN